MPPLDTIILGLVQGITEFLPVSSSGHLILVREVFGLGLANTLAFDAVLQLATACAIGVYFRRDIVRLASVAWGIVRGASPAREDAVLIGALVLGTLPAVAAGLMLETYMETTFRAPAIVGWMLIAGAALLTLADFVARCSPDPRPSAPTLSRGLIVGLFQCLALVPGVSRSGATIAGGVFVGWTRAYAARFSFLLSLPILAGTGLKKLIELVRVGGAGGEWGALALASLVAAASGLLVIHYLLRYLAKHSFLPFILYRLVLAAVVFLYLA